MQTDKALQNVCNALRFLRALPRDIPFPTVGISEDRLLVSFSWLFRSKNNDVHAYVNIFHHESEKPECLEYSILRDGTYIKHQKTNPDECPDELIQYLREAMELYDY